MDGHTKTPDTEMVEADDLHHVLDLLDKMDKREATVLRMRFGLDDEEPEDAQGNRREPRPDPRARPPDRERSAGETQREHEPGLNVGTITGEPSPRKGPGEDCARSRRAARAARRGSAHTAGGACRSPSISSHPLTRRLTPLGSPG